MIIQPRCLEKSIKFLIAKFIVVVLVAFPSVSFAGYSLIVQTNSRTTSSVDGQPTRITQGRDSAASTSQGTESSQCQAYGRPSSASALASAIETLKQSDSVGISLSAVVTASGGHYRTCGACAFNQCIGIQSQDTRSNAEAKSNASILLKFDELSLPGLYKVTLIQEKIGESENATVVMKDANGKILPETSQGVFEVQGNPNYVYQINAEVNSASGNEGGCCTDKRSTELKLHVLVERLAQMQAAQIPFVLGGAFTKEYPQVGLITLRERDGTVTPHCTGTLIGGRTVLTAAHCIADDFKDAAKEHRLRFVLGTSMDDPDAESFSILETSFPTTDLYKYKLVKNPAGDVTTIDDIAVAYLDMASKQHPLRLYTGSAPTLQSLIINSEPLPFVGFGLYSINPDGTGGSGSGKKRQAFVSISSQDKRTFYYKTNSNGQGVCKGDSGGPALVETPPSDWRVLGITAFGAGNCKDGRSMKVDAFVDWVTPLIKN